MRRGAARLRAAEAAESVAEACCRGASVERGRGCAWCGRGIRSASACLRWRRVRMPKRRRLPCWWRGACGVCRRLSRGASSTPSRRRWRRLSPRRCRPRRPRGRRPPPTPRPTARAPTPPPRPPRRAGRPCRSGRGAAALGERARGAARRVALAEVVAPPVALRRRRAPPTRATRAPSHGAAEQLAEVTAVTAVRMRVLRECRDGASRARRASRRRVARAARAIFKAPRPPTGSGGRVHWGGATLPVGGRASSTGRYAIPSGTPTGSVRGASGDFQSAPRYASGSTGARLAQRRAAPRRGEATSPGPTRRREWGARHYRARATSSGGPSSSTVCIHWLGVCFIPLVVAFCLLTVGWRTVICLGFVQASGFRRMTFAL